MTQQVKNQKDIQPYQYLFAYKTQTYRHLKNKLFKQDIKIQYIIKL